MQQPDFLANGADLIDRRETLLTKYNRKIILCDVYFGKLFNFNKFIMNYLSETMRYEKWCYSVLSVYC